MPAPDPIIIGFDSEYESDSKNPKRNVLLSIQWCVLGPHGEAAGIWHILDGKRPRFEEWIARAVQDAIAKKVIPKWPVEVWACAHFTAAEVSMFGRREKTIRRLDLLRNTFTTMRAKQFSVSVGGHKREFLVRLVDTKLLSPAKNQSLAALGAVVGLPKIEIAKSDIEAMGSFRERNLAGYERYAINDAVIVARYLRRLLDFIREHELQAEGGCPITLGGLSVGGVEASLRRQGISHVDFFGIDRKTVKKWIESQGLKKKVASRQPQVELGLRNPFYTAMQAYMGGRNECFIFGPRHAGPYFDYDLKGAYSAAMAAIRVPDWKNWRRLSEDEELATDDLAVAFVEFEFPTEVRFPVFACDGKDRGLIFPRRGETLAWAPEIVVARNLGAKIKIRDGYKIPWLDTRRPLATFAKEMTDLRNKAKAAGDEFSNMLAKELANSAYGKMGQGLKDKSVFNIKRDESEKLGPSSITCPFFAGFITAMVRAVLAEILNALPHAREVINVITDGFLSNATEAEVRAACEGELATLFHECRVLVSDDPSGIIEVKGSADSVCASRTRQHFSFGAGAAVLDGEEDDDSDEQNNIAAHVGIKFDETDFEGCVDSSAIKRRRSELLLGLFAGREKGQKRKESRLRNGRDLVKDPECDITMDVYEHKLQMEYDFKRQVDVVETSELAGHQHITFTTKPWETLADFEGWRDQINGVEFVLKTEGDLAELTRAKAQRDHVPSAGKKKARHFAGEGRKEKTIREIEKAVAADPEKKPGAYAERLRAAGVDADAGRIREHRKNLKGREGRKPQAAGAVELPATVTVVDVLHRSQGATGVPYSHMLAPGDAKNAADTQIYVWRRASELAAVEGVSVDGRVEGLSATDEPRLRGLKAVFTRAGEAKPFLEEDLRENPNLRIPGPPET